jgi:CheY-like chemotaxis protein
MNMLCENEQHLLNSRLPTPDRLTRRCVVLTSKTSPLTWKEDALVNKLHRQDTDPARRNPALPKAKRRILLVGDYPSNQKLRATILEKQGYAVDVAQDTDEARALWRPRRYGLVIVDIERSPWAGIKFCQEIRKIASPQQQVAFLVGYRAPAATVSTDTLIPKGEHPKYFVDRIRRLFREVAQREVA